MNIVITGSSTGIGRALADRLLAHGHRVWGLARSGQTQLERREPNFRGTRCDVSDYRQVHRAARQVAAAWKRVDALITCAAIHGEIGRALAASPAKWSATVRVDLDGTFHALRAFAPLLAKSSRRAKVVCFSGGGAANARPNFSAYAAAKAGVVRLVETVAAEEPRLDINAVGPGAIATRLIDEIVAVGPSVAGQKEFASAREIQSAGRAALANALDLIEWLLSPRSDGVSGLLIAAKWDPWRTFGKKKKQLRNSELYKLRRIVPAASPRRRKTR